MAEARSIGALLDRNGAPPASSSSRDRRNFAEKEAEAAARMARRREQIAAELGRYPCGCLVVDPNTLLGVPEHQCCACRDLGYVRRRDLPLEHPDFGKYLRCPKCQAKRVLELDRFCELARIDDLHARLSFKDFNPRPDAAAKKAAMDYVKAWPPAVPFLVLASETPGNGKTMLANSIQIAAYGRHRVRSECWTAGELVDRYRRANAADAEERPEDVDRAYRELPLLVIDDLGREYGTEYAAERLHQVLNYRHGHLLPTVITTNVGEFEPRLASRLRDGKVSLVVHLRGRDRRTQARLVAE